MSNSIGVPKPLRELLHARRSVGVNRRLQSHRPGIIGKQAEFRVVVGVVVRDEDVAQLRERKFRLDELATYSVAGIDHVGHIVVDDQICRRRWCKAGADRRPAARAQSDEAVGAKIRPGLLREGHAKRERLMERGRGKAHARGKQMSACDHSDPVSSIFVGSAAKNGP